MGCNSSKQDVPPPKTKVDIPQGDLAAILQNQLKGRTGTIENLVTSDVSYSLFPREQLEAFLKSDKTDEIKYLSEKFDCDDFAKCLMAEVTKWYRNGDGKGGIAFGLFHGNVYLTEDSTKELGHAMNWFVDDKKTVWIYEPQNDKLYTPNKKSNYYFVYC